MSYIKPIYNPHTPLQINLSHQDSILTLKKYLNDIFCKDVVSIIISYRIPLHWKYRKDIASTSSSQIELEFGFIDDISICLITNRNNGYYITIRSLREKYIFSFLKFSETIYSIYIDSPYIYLLFFRSIGAVHYYNKSIRELTILNDPHGNYGYSISFIKNKIFYTTGTRLNKNVSIVGPEGTHEIKNICLYSPENDCTKISTTKKEPVTQWNIFAKKEVEYTLRSIDSMCVNDENNIAVTIGLPQCYWSDESIEGRSVLNKQYICKLQLEKNVELLCISLSEINSHISYYDDEHIIYSNHVDRRIFMYCYNTNDNILCGNEVEKYENIYVSKDTILFKKDKYSTSAYFS